MALLRSIELNTVPGLSYVNYTPAFLGLSIICVKREGRQYKRTTGAPTGRSWSLGGGISLKLRFASDIPFNEGEKVFVIYKPIV